MGVLYPQGLTNTNCFFFFFLSLNNEYWVRMIRMKLIEIEWAKRGIIISQEDVITYQLF